MKNGIASMRDIEQGAREHERKIFEGLGLAGDEKLFGLSQKNTRKVLGLMRVAWQDGFQGGFAFSEKGGKLNIHPEDDELQVS